MSVNQALSGVYQALPPGRYTRVIEMVESTPNAAGKLTLRLSLLDLDDIAPLGDDDDDDGDVRYGSAFVALSYTWGAPIYGAQWEEDYSSKNDVTVNIIAEDVGSHLVSIGRNLYEALTHIWNTGHRFPLWVDAVCINQLDMDEKQGQILMMGDIYSKASLVIVWMGIDDPVEPTFEDVLFLHTEFLEQLQQYIQDTGPVRTTDFTQDPATGILKIRGQIELPHDRMKSLYLFYNRRRYLNRAWIVQEVVLSRRPVVLLGDTYLSFVQLSTLNDIIGRGGIGGAANAYMSGGASANTGEGIELCSLRVIASQVQYWNSNAMASDMTNIYGAHDNETIFMALLEYFLDGRASFTPQVTDPRDSINALLGLVQFCVPHESAPWRPDYTASVEDVFTKFTAQQLTRLPNRTILSLVKHRSASDERACIAFTPSCLPSWVPDFTGGRSSFRTLFATANSSQTPPKFQAAKDQSQYSHIRIEGRELVLYGRRCSKVAMTLQPRTEPHPNPETHEAHYLRDLGEATSVLNMCTSLGPASPTGASTVEAIYRVLCYSSVETHDDCEFRDDVRNLLCAMAREPQVLYPDVSAAAKRFESLLRRLQNQAGIPSDEYLERYERTLSIAFARKLGENSRDKLIRIQDLWPELDIFHNGELGEDLQNLWRKRAGPRILAGDTFFTTEDRYIGRIANDIRPGDELWLICQAKVPFILRPTHDGKYILLGEAFVHGAMYGELMDNGVAGEPVEITIV